MLVRVAFKLICKLITRPARAGPGRIAALDHEIGNYSVKHGRVIEIFPGQKHEIVHRLGSILGEKLAEDFAARSIKRCGVLFVHIDRHRRRSGIFLRHATTLAGSGGLTNSTMIRSRFQEILTSDLWSLVFASHWL